MGLVMAAGLMSGCGGQTKEADNNKKDSQEKAMGRYVEEDLKPPVQDGETPVGAYEKDGTPVSYTHLDVYKRQVIKHVAKGLNLNHIILPDKIKAKICLNDYIYKGNEL